jgi:hypothetical protein
MAEENIVRIVEWPPGLARLEHHFDLDKPCPVVISFEPTPANVVLSTERQQPLAVDMNMHLSAREPVPICIKLCEPICARSDYTIGITLFDRPIISITIKGTTKVFNCNEEL